MVDSTLYRISVRSLDQAFEARRSETLLEALLAQGLDYPHGCTTGLCGLCKSRLISGTVEHDSYFESALPPNEHDAGLILPCCAHPLSDCVMTPVQPDAHMPPVQSFEAAVCRIDRLTHDTVRLKLLPASGLRYEFLPGQYAALTLPGGPARDFSMASEPGGPTVDFLIRRVPGGEVTDRLLPSLATGDTVGLKGPYGLAYLREDHLGPIVAIAGGSGLAPVLSIVSAALHRGMTQPIHVYAGMRAEQDVCLEDELAALAQAPNVSLHIVLSEPAADAGDASRRTGLVHEVVAADLAGLGMVDWNAYIAGPPPMVDAAVRTLTSLGVRPQRCFADPFLTRADRAPATAAPT